MLRTQLPRILGTSTQLTEIFLQLVELADDAGDASDDSDSPFSPDAMICHIRQSHQIQLIIST